MLHTARLNAALSFAGDLHRDQVRKGSGVPYIGHLLAVASTVIDYGGNEDTAIAALLHDALEDQAHHFPRGVLASLIEVQFGPRVLSLVRSITETDVDPKPPWKQRKLLYVEHLRKAEAPSHLICAADKLHNALSTARDLKRYGEDDTWKRFNANRKSQAWWYGSVFRLLDEENKVSPLLLSELAEVLHFLFPELGVENWVWCTSEPKEATK